jgi:hypothetical protein
MNSQPMAIAVVAIAMGVLVPAPESRRRIRGDRLILRAGNEMYAVFERPAGERMWRQVTDVLDATQLDRWPWFCRAVPTAPDHPFDGWIAAIAPVAGAEREDRR